jgi:hypothetical protein
MGLSITEFLSWQELLGHVAGNSAMEDAPVSIVTVKKTRSWIDQAKE